MAVRHWQLAGFVMAYIVLSAPAVLAEAGPYETVLTRETLEFVRAYYKIQDPTVRKRVFELTKAVAKG